MWSCWTWVNSSSQKCDLVVRHHSGLDSPFKNGMKSLVSFPDHSPLPEWPRKRLMRLTRVYSWLLNFQPVCDYPDITKGIEYN